MKKLDKLTEQLKDGRGMEVIFISHCLLNVNTRYLGGAFRRGSVNEIISEAMEKGIGIVQVKCPEQQAWGGVLKWIIWLPFDTRNTILYFFERFFIPLFVLYTRLIYRRIAKRNLETPLYAHSLISEMQGEESKIGFKY